ncbi:MAC Perforin domain containing protein [Seminavis robusta]|uniref:MAC Perforin domain containing protein n=1 Tax=Seminavis robusta TaxID=568900 RepID=A0A9N8DYC5_9STRA|nr:MAC Perforin domain containing protein [Seminavis robusta]|eukprot:Sro443_g144190.1 MAC Perforin domain containing protein (593) ;mRNA; r:62181-63959
MCNNKGKANTGNEEVGGVVYTEGVVGKNCDNRRMFVRFVVIGVVGVIILVAIALAVTLLQLRSGGDKESSSAPLKSESILPDIPTTPNTAAPDGINVDRPGNDVDQPSLNSVDQPTVDPENILPDIPTMPNIDYLFKGYDVMLGNPLGQTDGGFQLPIFDATYRSVQKTDDLRYLIPDKVSTIPSCEACDMVFTSTVIESSEEYIDSLMAKVDVAASGRYAGFKGSFSASVGYELASERINELQQISTQSEASCCAYIAEVQTFDPPAFHENFLAALDTLTDEYDQNIYWNFVYEFGTHYVKQVTMGALFGEESFLTWENRRTLESDGISLEVGAAASGWGIAVSVDAEYDQRKQERTSFQSNTQSRKTYTRGSLPPTDGDTATWAAATRDNPAPINIELARIDFLSHLPVTDDVKANLGKFLDEYCTIGTCDPPPRPQIPNAPTPAPVVPTPAPTSVLSSNRFCRFQSQPINPYEIEYSKEWTCDNVKFAGPVGFRWHVNEDNSDEYRVEVNEVGYKSSERWATYSHSELLTGSVQTRYTIKLSCMNESQWCYIPTFFYTLVDCGCPDGWRKVEDCRYGDVESAKSARCVK